MQAERAISKGPRNDGTRDEIKSVYDSGSRSPFPQIKLESESSLSESPAHSLASLSRSQSPSLSSRSSFSSLPVSVSLALLSVSLSLSVSLALLSVSLMLCTFSGCIFSLESHDMDQHQQGPSIWDVLTRQDVHCSSLLWDAPLADERVPGVLTCRRREKGLFEAGLDPRIAAYIKDVGLDGLLRVPNIDVDHALITALVERWRPETHSFHLPHGEMTITLQDMEVIMGVPVVGLPVVGFTRMDKWADLYAELLGHRPPDRELGGRKNTAVMEGPRVKAKWLEERFRNPLPADATEMLMQQYARFYILEMLAGILFMDKSGERHNIMYLQFFNPISNGKNYSWGSAALISNMKVMFVLFARWKGAKITTEHPTHVLCAYRVSLASLRPNQIVWEPYQNDLGSLPAYCTAGQHIWRSIVPLIHFWVVEGHHPERVLRQFGMKQGIPENVDTSIELHKITLQGKQDKNWAEEHARYIGLWAAHATIADAPPFEG
ncbi:hypothetical protein SO802_013770 [Lithocarpus litseifolius]|uniref:Aminotransferase-like plant mobile domain-containing protein n=1 Tax=Lithocarpus litseifolius TaxID=425828 RepID=A0AAW2D7E9_9ROSI